MKKVWLFSFELISWQKINLDIVYCLCDMILNTELLVSFNKIENLPLQTPYPFDNLFIFVILPGISKSEYFSASDDYKGIDWVSHLSVRTHKCEVEGNWWRRLKI